MEHIAHNAYNLALERESVVDVQVLPQTPRKNTGSRTRRPHHKNWFVYLLLHFMYVSLPSLVACASKSCRRPTMANW